LACAAYRSDADTGRRRGGSGLLIGREPPEHQGSLETALVRLVHQGRAGLCRRSGHAGADVFQWAGAGCRTMAQRAPLVRYQL